MFRNITLLNGYTYELDDTDFTCKINSYYSHDRAHILSPIIQAYKKRHIPFASNVARFYLLCAKEWQQHINISDLIRDKHIIVRSHIQYEWYFECVIRHITQQQFGLKKELIKLLNK